MSTEYIWYNGKYQAVGDSEVVRQLRVKVVDSLPTEGSPGYIYIVPGDSSENIAEGISYTTVAPTKANTDGLKFVVLPAEPTTKYDGWIYIITEE